MLEAPNTLWPSDAKSHSPAPDAGKTNAKGEGA